MRTLVRVDPLAPLSPTTRSWFENAFREPTPAQVQGWPAIASGEHVLIQAPTGSGKTLAAFLYGIDRLTATPGEGLRLLYVSTARAKGLSQRQVLYGHVFRNAMLIVIAGFPGAVIGVFFGSSLLIETIFSLDGLGLLGYEAALQRDYPVMFGTLYFFALLGLLTNLVGDFSYTLVDPRIDFEKREL